MQQKMHNLINPAVNISATKLKYKIFKVFYMVHGITKISHNFQELVFLSHRYILAIDIHKDSVLQMNLNVHI